MAERVAFPGPPRFVAGAAVGIVGPATVALLDTDPRSPLVGALWKVVSDGSPFDDVTEMIVAHGVRSLPSIAVVAIESGQVRCLVRGAMQVNLYTDAQHADVQVVAADVTTWREHLAHDVRSAEIFMVDDMTQVGVFHLSSGIVPASRLVVRVADDESDVELIGRADTFGQAATIEPDQEISASRDLEPSAGDDQEDLEPIVTTDELLEPVAEVDQPPATDGDDVGAEVENAADEGPEEADPEVAVPDRSNLTVRFDDEDAAAAAEAIDEVDPPPVEEPEPSAAPEADDYDHLFGATQYRPLSEAGVHPVESDSGLAPSTHQPEAVISSVPSSAAPDSPARDSPAPSNEGDHDGMTISLAQLRAARAGEPPSSGPPVRSRSGSQHVHAVTCSSGHLNPTSAVICRVCELEIPEQAHISVQRPLLGTFEFSFGLAQPVVRPMLLGRSPVAKGPVSGELPELVTLPSPNKELSGTHLEIRLDGWQVSVVDRQSTNGTTVQLPGRDPQRVHPDEPFQIIPGAVVDLAGEVQFTYAAPDD